MENIRFDKDKHPSFKTQFNKIVGAYMKDKLEPFNGCACFLGNLLNNKSEWGSCRVIGFNGEINKSYSEDIYYKQAIQCIDVESNGLYTPEEVTELEDLFLHTISENWMHLNRSGIKPSEESLYKAMEVTLLKLREIHESKGEIVEEYTFEKRELQLN